MTFDFKAQKTRKAPPKNQRWFCPNGQLAAIDYPDSAPDAGYTYDLGLAGASTLGP